MSRAVTEQRNPATGEIDQLPTLAILRLMNREDAGVAGAVGQSLEPIARAVDAVVERLSRGGRLIYMGAGTSGRLAVLDASECPPTFGVPPEMVQALIAGGERALRRAAEGAEDDREAGRADLAQLGAGALDAVVGIAASGATPYVLGAMAEARQRGAVTIGLSNNPDSPLSQAVDMPIVVVTGPEVITGSTRLKAGTAQKMVLNMISTAAMIRLGKTYGNLMVDLQATNDKLRRRAQWLVAEATGVSPDEAGRLLGACGGEVKTAIVVQLLGIDAATARARLQACGGRVREALYRDPS